MKRHAFTAFVLLLAIAAYAVGLSGWAPALLGAAVALELWFWVRLLRRH